jgi:hypothetical protein
MEFADSWSIGGKAPNPTSLTAAMAVFQAASVSDAALFLWLRIAPPLE